MVEVGEKREKVRFFSAGVTKVAGELIVPSDREFPSLTFRIIKFTATTSDSKQHASCLFVFVRTRDRGSMKEKWTFDGPETGKFIILTIGHILGLPNFIKLQQCKIQSYKYERQKILYRTRRYCLRI